MSKSNRTPANPQYREQKREAALKERKVTRSPVDPYCDDGLDAWEAQSIAKIQDIWEQPDVPQ